MNNTIRKIAAASAAIYSAMIIPFNASASSVIRGDVNGDSQITVTDIALVASHIKGINALDSDETTRADVNRDKKIDVSDIAIIASHIKGIKAIKNDFDNKSESTPDPTEEPVHTDGTLFYSRENDYFSFVGADDPHQDAVQFKKSGYYDLVEYSCEHDLTTGEYSNVKLKSIIDGTSYANETKMKKAKGTEYSAGDKFTVGRRGAYLLLYKASETDVPSVFIVVTDKSGTSASGTISCARTELGENYAEYEFTIQYRGTRAKVQSVAFYKDGTEYDREQSTLSWGSPYSFRRKFYANGNYTVKAFFGEGACSQCSFTISGIDEGAVVPIADNEDCTPPKISYSISPNSTGMRAGQTVTVTINTDEPAVINFNGMSSADWVTSWDFPVYTNGSWLVVASDKQHNGNSITINVTNFGDGTTSYTEPQEPGNPLNGHDPDSFWNDINTLSAFDDGTTT